MGNIVKRPEIGKLYLTALKFCKAKSTVLWMKTQVIEWCKLVASYISEKGLLSRIYKMPKYTLAIDLNMKFSKEKLLMTSKHLKKCSASSAKFKVKQF